MAMTRAEAQEWLANAVTVAVTAGLEPQEVQAGIAFGYRDAGKLRLADLAERGYLTPEIEESALGVAPRRAR